MHPLREIAQTLRNSPVFVLAVLLTLGLAGLNGLMVVLMNSVRDLLPGPLAQMRHFTEVDHRTHDLTFGFLFVPTIVGMLAQLRRPARNGAGQVMALIPWAGLLLTLSLTQNTSVVNPAWMGPAASTLIATILYPTWQVFIRSFQVARINWVMLTLVIIAAGPLLAFAFRNFGLQTTVPDAHAGMGHYGFMAAFAFTIIGVGLLASLRPAGWRLTARVAGLLPALLGITSVQYPDVSSSLGLGWALAAIAWGVVFVAAAELAQRTAPVLDHSAGSDRESPPGPPRWLQVSGVIGLVVVVLFVGLTVNGSRLGGPGNHVPPAGVPPTGEAGGHTPPIQHGP